MPLTAEPCTGENFDQQKRVEPKKACNTHMAMPMPANDPTRRDEEVCTEPLSGESSSGSDSSSDEQAAPASHAHKTKSKRKKKKQSKAKSRQQVQCPQQHQQQQMGGVPYFLANPGYPMMIPTVPPMFFQSQGYAADTVPPCMAYPCYVQGNHQAGAMFVPVPMEQSAQMYPYYADPRTMQMQPACNSSAASSSQFLSPVTPQEAALLNQGASGMDDDLPGPPIATVADGHGPEDCNLFVFHLPNDMNNLSLYNLFANYGPVASSRIMVDSNTGRSRGFGFVSFTTRDSAEAAQASLDGYSIGKKRLKVQFKTPPSRSLSDNAKSSTHGHNRQASTDVQETAEMLSNASLNGP